MPQETPRELKKHVGAIHIRNSLTLLQRKVANVLLLNAYENLPSRETHFIHIGVLVEQLGFDSNDHVLLRDALTTLASTTVEWNLLDERGREIWGVTTMLASARLHTGTGQCEYTYSRDLRERLYNPDVYARINLAIQRRFTSSYALALYENCIRYRRIGCTGWWSLNIFRELMGVEEGEYPQFPELNRRVIKIAMQQVNEGSDISLEVEFRREQRRVAELRFKVSDNPQLRLFQSPEQVLEELRRDGEAIPGAVESGPPAELIVALEAAGVGASQTRRLLRNFDSARIRRNLDLFEADRAAGKVARNPGGYLVRAIREDFAANRVSPTDNPPAPDAATQALPAADSALTTEALAGYRSYLDRARLDAYRALPVDKRASLEEAFGKSLGNLVDRKMLAERGIEGDSRLRERFVALLTRRGIGIPLDFRSWATGEGYQLVDDAEAEHGQRVVARMMSD